MKTEIKIKTMTLAGLLCAIGIIIPIFAPKIVLEPASFTLASHVPVFIAMFISPSVSISVALLTSLGFLVSGTPIIIVLRALTHVIFAALGSYMLKKNNNILLSLKSTGIFSFLIALVHAAAEVTVVTYYYWGGSMTAYEEKGYLVSVLGLVGLGTIIHSMIDFGIAVIIWNPLQKIITIPANAKVKTRAANSRL
jgi:niacin transporter